MREEYDPLTQSMIPRKYFSGGAQITPGEIIRKTKERGPLLRRIKQLGGMASMALLAVALAGCGGGGGSTTTGGDTPDEITIPDVQPPMVDRQSVFLPLYQKTAWMVGQYPEVIEEYIDLFGTPAGFMTYTSIQELSGLTEPADASRGGHYAQQLLDAYPNVAVQLGLYMVNALPDVNLGLYDENIDRLAAWIKAANRPVYLRIGYEFDNEYNQYDPEQYKDAYRRIVDRFDELGVDNVAFVWHSINIEGSLERADEYYPGDAYVDYIAVSVFGTDQMQWGQQWAEFADRHNKGFMIAESAPHGRQTVAERVEWFNQFFDFIRKSGARIVSYINGSFDTAAYLNGEEDYLAVQSNPEIRDQWAVNVINDADSLHTLDKTDNPYEDLGYDPETNGPADLAGDQSMMADLSANQKQRLNAFIQEMTVNPQGIEGLTEEKAMELATALIPKKATSQQAGLLPLTWLTLLINAAGQAGLSTAIKTKFNLSDAETDRTPGSEDQRVGGIDLTQNFLYLQIKRDTAGIVLPAELQDIENIHFDGLEPIITNIAPMPQVAPFLGIQG